MAACDDDDAKPTLTPSPEASSVATAGASPSPVTGDLAAMIDTRADLPRHDPIELAARYGRTPGRAAASKPFAGEAAAGSDREFTVVTISGSADGPAPRVTNITATLMEVTAHAYFYADASIGVDAGAMQTSAAEFEEQIWPEITGIFGPPPMPGVDGDPRIIVLLADLGAVGGYHSGDDLYLRAVRPLSNEAEMVYIDSSNPAGSFAFDVVLAHELQHLIHEQNDSDEEAWVNEGLSVTAERPAGGALSTIDSFEGRPTTQLNRWEFGGNLPHYGAGGAFFLYLAARFGGDAELGRIADADGDGPVGIDEFLASTGTGLTFAEVFADWIAANVLNRAEGPYANPTRRVDALIERSLSVGEPAEAAANQFGADYYELSGISGGDYVLRFSGEATVAVLPAPDDGRGAFWWSNRGDSINTTLTRELEIGEVAGQRLTFETWYDIEPYYDRGYVSVSTDGGATWLALPSTSTSDDDPVQLALGPGVDGRSGGGTEPRWVTESVDLKEFRGQTIQLRFEYVTDGGTHGEGWAIRDVAYHDWDVRRSLSDAPGWTADGWVRIDRALPQQYIVRIIGERADGEPIVLDVPLDAQGDGGLRFNTDGATSFVVAIAGATEGTNQPAPYAVELGRP